MVESVTEMSAPAELLVRARAAAAAVTDPEIPVLTIADLGVLRDVSLEGDTVQVTITPTYTGCPAMSVIAQELEAALARAGFTRVHVRTVLSPAWTSDWITATGQARLAAYGIAPPRRDSVAPACPHCGCAETELLSAFGSTACKALHRCVHCREPFEAFKCH